MYYEFWNSLRLMRRVYGQSIEQVSHRFSMTRAELDVLLFLANNPQLDRAADIVELRGLTKSHVSIAVKALCDGGYLEACQDQTDRRVIHLMPTEKAQPVIAAGQKAQKEHLPRLFAGFSQEEIACWKALQVKLIDNARIMQ